MALSDSDRLPLIGLTTYVETARWGAWEQPAALLPDQYLRAVHDGGGAAVLLPPEPGAGASVLDRLDGLVLTGGPDLDPARYGQEAHVESGAPRASRDEWELEVCRLALARNMPLLAICRGAQILNVARGGTLHQHLPEQVGHTGHRPAPGTFGRTSVKLDADSAVGHALGPRVTVHCSHHQALDRIGAGIAVVGTAEDGTIEAVEIPGRRFAVGVQWHPEDDPTDRRIFAALVDAARAVSFAPEAGP